MAKDAKATASEFRGNDQRFGPDKTIDQNKNSYWTTDDGIKAASLTLSFAKPVSFNRLLVQEYIRLGQRVKSFSVEALVNGEWKEISKQTTIGYKRILRFPTVIANKLRLNITDAKSCPLISNIEVYDAPIILEPPAIMREKSGDLRIIPSDTESYLYYTLDGSLPTIKSHRYTGPVKTSDGKLMVKSISFDPHTKKYSAMTEEKFDIARKSWKITGVSDGKSNELLDGNPNTQWYQDSKKKMPVDLVIDLGKTENVNGFRYLPDQHWWATGIITNYILFVSEDGYNWKQVDEGEFPNIKNNPVWQTKTFTPVKTRYVKLRALKNTQDNDVVGYAEFDVITK